LENKGIVRNGKNVLDFSTEPKTENIIGNVGKIFKNSAPDVALRLLFMRLFDKPCNILARLPHGPDTLHIIRAIEFETEFEIPLDGSCGEYTNQAEIKVNIIEDGNWTCSPGCDYGYTGFLSEQGIVCSRNKESTILERLNLRRTLLK
jgi:hypothetical protein